MKNLLLATLLLPLLGACAPGISASLDAALRSRHVVTHTGGGTIDAPVVLPAGSKLHLGPGTYDLTDEGIILWGDDTEISGAGPETVLVEPPTGFQVLRSAADSADGLSAGNPHVRIHDLTIRGSAVPGHPLSGTYSAIGIGNSSDVRIDRVAILDTHAIGIEAGDGSATGNLARDVTVRKCRFSGVFAVNLAAVNATGFLFADNTFERGGAAGGGNANTVYIDMEPNTPTDTLVGTVTGNRMDMTASPPNPYVGWPTIGGVEVAGMAADQAISVTVSDNTVTGGDGSVAHAVSDQAGIATYGAHGVTVTGNTVSFMTGYCIALDSYAGLGGGNTVTGNTVTQCGTAAIVVSDHGDTVSDNTVSGGTQVSPAFSGLPWILEVAGGDGNSYTGNGFSPTFLLDGGTVAPLLQVTGALSTASGNTGLSQ